MELNHNHSKVLVIL